MQSSILTLSNGFLGIDNRVMKSESGFSFAIASKPFDFIREFTFGTTLMADRPDKTRSSCRRNLSSMSLLKTFRDCGLHLEKRVVGNSGAVKKSHHFHDCVLHRLVPPDWVPVV